MYDWRLVCMQENHTSCNLFGDADPCFPRERDLGLMQDIEQGGPVTVFVDNVVKILMLGHTDKSDQLRMVSNFH